MAWLRRHIFLNDDVALDNVTERYALLSPKGPLRKHSWPNGWGQRRPA